MTVTVASFKAAMPEFLKAGDTQIAAQLALVELEVSDSFGTSRDLAVMLKLADALTSSPMGRDARLLLKDAGAATTYGVRYEEMKRANAVSASRMGTAPVNCR